MSMRSSSTNRAIACRASGAAADLERAKTGHFTYTISVASLTPSLRVALGVYDEVSRDYAVGLVNLPAPSAK
jgi:hypothetical protein